MLQTKNCRNAGEAFRQFMTSQQQLGTGASMHGANGQAKKTSFINYENTFGMFQFEMPTVADPMFRPHFLTATKQDPVTGNAIPYLGVQFLSALNGSGMRRITRPPLSVVLVVDVSGSMGQAFQNDESSEPGGRPLWTASDPANSKLGVAKKCMHAIIGQLGEADKLAIVLFNHTQNVLLPLTPATQLNRQSLARSIDRLHPSGGTKLADGFQQGMQLLECKDVLEGAEGATSRVIFLTDMESGLQDEQQVTAIARKMAVDPARRFYTSVVGIGVDLSVGAPRHPFANGLPRGTVRG
jgi:hypothetical protein